jgi:hypothetical protein
MEFSIENLKDISTLAKPFIEPIIQTLLKPQLDRLGKWIKKTDTEGKVIANFWEDKFSHYLANLYDHSSYLTTLVFPNQQTKIKDLYVPLTIVASRDGKQYRIDSSELEVLNTYQRIIISDSAGMGKSTLLKWITISLIEQNKSIPILIELRKIDDKVSIVDEIFNQLDPIDKSFDKDLIYKFLELGFFTVLLDGFDEIPFDEQERVTIQMKDFIKKVGQNRFILTSRPEPALSSFPDFQLFNIKSLNNQEAFHLIGKLDDLSKVKYGDNLIKEVKEKNQQVQEFLTNPFLVSLLYKSYTYNKDIPSKKITFYEEVYSCLFKHHDLSKEGFKRPKRSRLDIHDFELILQDCGFETAKVGKVIYNSDELLQYIKNAKAYNSRIEFKESNFLEDLTTTVPLFVYEGNKIKWAHKSLQDFFAAKFIANHIRKEEILEKLFNAEKFQYLNILDLLYELEPKIFRKKITKKVLEDFIAYHDKCFPDRGKINAMLIEERIACTFKSTFCIIKVEEEIGFQRAKEIFLACHRSDEKIGIGATYHHGSIKYYTMSENSFVRQVIRILALKGENIFMEPKDFYWNNHLEGYETNKAYIIDDDISQVYNQSEKFEGVTDLLKDRLLDRNDRRVYLLDYKKCVKQLAEINEEIEADSSQDLLIGL